MPRDLPAGTVTFVFTDIEGSTRLLGELGADEYAAALSSHRAIVREACARFGGSEVDTEGDAFFLAFPTARGALEAAAAIRDAPQRDRDPAARIGIHTGTPLLTEDGYVGVDVHRAARIAAAGAGGQILVSAATAALVDADMRDLGEHRFKDLRAAERVFQLGQDQFPPLRSLRNVNLPVPATPFLGRADELEAVEQLLGRGDVRLLSLVGSGGTGKTRLALQAAADAADGFADGVHWVPLAALDDPGQVLPAVAQAVGAKERAGEELSATLLRRLDGRNVLILVDNMEHLLPEAAGEVAALMGVAGPTLLVTTRERLQLQGEQVYRVPTFTASDASAFFASRARAVDSDFEPTAAVDALCERLDNLPLALELAAARTAVFSPKQLLERLAKPLDLLRGARDADPRQQTLRATISWSYELLDPEEQRLFARLSVFRRGCTYEAAETVCAVDADLLQSLLDKSLLRRREALADARYWMLQSVREFASEQLEQADDADALRRRHAEWMCGLAERLGGRLTGLRGHPTGPPGTAEAALDRLDDEAADIEAALEWAWTSGEQELALRLGTASIRLWLERDRFGTARRWLDLAAPALEAAADDVRLQALKAAGLIAFFAATDSAAADAYWARALELAGSDGGQDDIGWLESRRAGVAWERGDLDLALELHTRGLTRARETGDRHREADILHLLGEVLRDLGRFDEAERTLEAAETRLLELGVGRFMLAANTHSLADLALDRGDLEIAESRYRVSLEQDGGRSAALAAVCAAGLASVCAERGEHATAAMLWGAVCGAEENLGFRLLGIERRRYDRRLQRLEHTSEWEAGFATPVYDALASYPPSGTISRL
jgi:predicted ATPase/class 3 adenylate cyclase